MFDEFQPALGNFAGTHQAMTLHFQSEPCNRDAFVTPGWAQCRHRLLINAGIACGKRSEEHTSELQSLMRISYAVFCLKKKTHKHNTPQHHNYVHNRIHI